MKLSGNKNILLREPREWACGESDSGSPVCETGVLPFDYRPA